MSVHRLETTSTTGWKKLWVTPRICTPPFVKAHFKRILHTTRSREAVRFRVSSHIDERPRAQRRIPGTQRGIVTVQFRRLAAGPNSHGGKAASKVVLPPVYLPIFTSAVQPPARPAPLPAFRLTSEGPPSSLPHRCLICLERVQPIDFRNSMSYTQLRISILLPSVDSVG